MGPAIEINFKCAHFVALPLIAIGQLYTYSNNTPIFCLQFFRRLLMVLSPAKVTNTSMRCYSQMKRAHLHVFTCLMHLLSYQPMTRLLSINNLRKVRCLGASWRPQTINMSSHHWLGVNLNKIVRVEAFQRVQPFKFSNEICITDRGKYSFTLQESHFRPNVIKHVPCFWSGH